MSFKKSVCNRISSSVTAVMQRKNKVVMAVAGATVASPAFADGFSKAETLLQKVKTGLSGLSLVTVTIACLWVYGVLITTQNYWNRELRLLVVTRPER